MPKPKVAVDQQKREKKLDMTNENALLSKSKVGIFKNDSINFVDDQNFLDSDQRQSRRNLQEMKSQVEAEYGQRTSLIDFKLKQIANRAAGGASAFCPDGFHERSFLTPSKMLKLDH